MGDSHLAQTNDSRSYHIVLPLLLMAYYNRDLAIDRLDENITRRLSQDLDITQQRISSAVEDEQDFVLGVNNDFCEAVA